MTSVPSPTKTAPEDPTARTAVLHACRRYRLDASGLRQIHRYNNVIYLLPREGLIARVTGPSIPVERAVRSQQVVDWLISTHRFPATAPITTCTPVVAAADLTVSFWRYYPQTTVNQPTSAHLAHLLRALHSVPAPPVQLDQWVPLRSLEHALHEPGSRITLSASEHAWLLERITRTRQELADLDWRLGIGLIHADAWAGNVLWDPARGPERVVLADWDNVCLGPREVDLIPTWHAAARFGRDRAWVAGFAEIYGHDLSGWTGFEVLMRMRDLVQLTGPLRRAPTEPVLTRALRQRLTAIRNHNRDAQWQAY